MGAMLFRKGTGGMNRSKGGKNSGGNDQAEGEERKPERNFRQSHSQKANKRGKHLGMLVLRNLAKVFRMELWRVKEQQNHLRYTVQFNNDTKNKFKKCFRPWYRVRY